MRTRITVLILMAGALFLGTQSLRAQCGGGSGHSCCGKKEATISMKTISLNELKQILNSGADYTLVDARDQQAFRSGHIRSAVSINSLTLPDNKNAVMVFYCGGLKCPLAEKAARKIAEQGYTNVMVFKGGWAEWSSQGTL